MSLRRSRMNLGKRATEAEPAQLDFPARIMMSVRWVRHNGEFRFLGKQHFLSEVLAREQIALEEVDDGIWSIYFYDRLLARFDQRTLKVVPATPKIVAAQPAQQFHGV